MNKTRVITIVAMLLVFAAGVSVGLLVAGRGKPPPPPPSLSVLASELKLTAEQRQQMEQIWSDVMGPAFRSHSQTRTEIQQEREQGILSLIPDNQRGNYDLVQQYYNFRMETLAKERQKAFDQAVEQTKKILSPEQAAKYDELMKQQREHWRQGGYRGSHRYGSTTRPATNPQSQPHGGA